MAKHSRLNGNLALAYSKEESTKAPPTKKSYSPHSLINVKAESESQAKFFDAFYSQVPVIFQAGSAGSGKTFVSIYAALSEIYDKDTPYDRLVLVRSAVQSRNIGFLKGSEEEKNEAYEDIYNGMFDELHRDHKNNYKTLKALGLLEFHNTSFMRGRTFDHSIIVVDEAANLSYEELYTIITRLGVYSKIVFCGDYKQSDLKGNEKSGYHRFIKVLEAMPSEMYRSIVYTPDDVVRSGVVKEFLLAEEKVYPSNL